MDDYQAFLSRHPLTSAFSAEQRQQLVQGTHAQQLHNNEHLFHQGDEAAYFYLLLEGKIKLYRLSADGHEKVIDIIQPGGSFAEAVMFMDHRRYPVCAQALRSSVVLGISNERYRQLLADNPHTCFRLLADLSIRLHQRLNEIETLTLQNATYRMIRYLLAKLPPDATDGIRIELPASKRLIASHLAIQPETFSRILARLKDDGLIDVHTRSIEVLNLKGLHHYH